MYRLISQRPGARHDPDTALFVNCPGHDADLTFFRGDDARAVRPDQARAPVLQKLPGTHHIQRGDALGDADNQFDFSIGRFHNRVSRIRWRHKNDCGICARLVRRFLNGIEDRPALVCCPALAGSHTAHNLRAISSASLRVECAFAAGQALHNQSSSLINQYCHDGPLSRFFRVETRLAASPIADISTRRP